MSEQQTITIEVDGKAIEAAPGQMLIEVTDAAGIAVPRFCYHKKLSIAANCRMCLVEVRRRAQTPAGLRHPDQRRHEGIHPLAAGA